jgi:hypothetical protein
MPMLRGQLKLSSVFFGFFSFLGLIKPFFTDYPYVISKDRKEANFQMNEGLFIKYILKLQPSSTGKYTVTWTPGANFRVT